MTVLGRLFSLVTLLVVVTAAALVIWLEPVEPVPEGGLPRISRIVIEKSARRMVVYDGAVALRSYPIALGFSPTGDKLHEGDGRTPEGVFRIDRKNAGSAFTLSLGLDYPQAEDRARARAGGYDPGGDIMIHGQPNAVPDEIQLKGDWTAGCIALSNAAIREVFAAAEIGTEVEVRP
jgi:murein L,D-transpeptidase YafK